MSLDVLPPPSLPQHRRQRKEHSLSHFNPMGLKCDKLCFFLFLPCDPPNQKASQKAKETKGVARWTPGGLESDSSLPGVHRATPLVGANLNQEVDSRKIIVTNAEPLSMLRYTLLPPPLVEGHRKDSCFRCPSSNPCPVGANLNQSRKLTAENHHDKPLSQC